LAKTSPTCDPPVIVKLTTVTPFVHCMYDPNREWFTIALA
jgi:hypothetical protein